MGVEVASATELETVVLPEDCVEDGGDTAKFKEAAPKDTSLVVLSGSADEG